MVESRDVADRNAARRVDGEVLDKTWASGNAVEQYRGGVLVLDNSLTDASTVSRCRGGVLVLD